ncbi:MAG: hypothetical protein ACYDGY_06885 [Acidimicrobiales bacterium]
MTYIYAGYIIALSVLFVYAMALMIRRARLEKTVRMLGSGSEGSVVVQPARLSKAVTRRAGQQDEGGVL